MPRVNTRDAHELISELIPFTTNGSIRGEWRGPDYVVSSYGTAIAVITPENGKITANTARYSVTTSKHQNTTSRALAALVARDGYDIEHIAEPAAFRELTGHYASERVI